MYIPISMDPVYPVYPDIHVPCISWYPCTLYILISMYPVYPDIHVPCISWYPCTLYKPWNACIWGIVPVLPLILILDKNIQGRWAIEGKGGVDFLYFISLLHPILKILEFVLLRIGFCSVCILVLRIGFCSICIWVSSDSYSGLGWVVYLGSPWFMSSMNLVCL